MNNLNQLFRAVDGNGAAAMDSYRIQIQAMPNISADEILSFGRNILQQNRLITRQMNMCGFVIDDYCRNLTNILNCENQSAYDVFLPSACQKFLPAKDKRKAEIKKIHDEVSAILVTRQELFAQSKVFAMESPLIASVNSIMDDLPFCMDFYTKHIKYMAQLFQIDQPENVHKINWDGFTDMQIEKLQSLFLLPWDYIKKLTNTVFNDYNTLLNMRKELMEMNLKLVLVVARDFAGKTSIAINDLVQEGNIGLMRAVEKFDFNFGYKFSTYACWWIKQNISRYLAEQSRIIRIPSHMIATISMIKRAEQQFIQEHGHEPESEELAEILEMTPAKVNAIRKMAQQPISLQSQSILDSGDKASELQDVIPDENAASPMEILADSVLYQQLRHVLSLLPEREQTIIIDRFGLFGHPALTLDDISKKFQLTKERIRQLEIKIINKLRSPEMMQYFDAYKHK